MKLSQKLLFDNPSHLTFFFLTLPLLYIIVPRETFGAEGRLIEIMNEEDQEVALNLIRDVEASFEICDPELSYWWTGLQDTDDDDDWVWKWVGSKYILISKGKP